MSLMFVKEALKNVRQLGLQKRSDILSPNIKFFFEDIIFWEDVTNVFNNAISVTQADH